MFVCAGTVFDPEEPTTSLGRKFLKAIQRVCELVLAEGSKSGRSICSARDEILTRMSPRRDLRPESC
jgi:hypothetical protein